MKQYYLLALITSAASITSYAQEVEVVSPYYVKGGFNASVLDDRKKESEGFGFEAMAGFMYKNDIFLEAGYQNFDLSRDDGIDLDALSIKANWLMPVSDYASIYVGPGFAFIENEVSPSAQVGIQYQLSTNWYADVSYQGIFDINELDDDLYSFHLSFLYRFSEPQNIVEDDPVIMTQPVIEKPVEVLPKRKVCRLENSPYRVVKGDYLLKIARANNLTLRDIIDLNPQLKNRSLDLVYPGEVIKYPRAVCQ